MYTLKLDKVKKVFTATVGGFITPEMGEAFVKDYTKEIKGINPKDFTLVVDSTELKPSPADSIPILKGCFEFYMKDGFKKILMVEAKSATTNMQLKRVGRETNFTGEFVKSV